MSTVVGVIATAPLYYYRGLNDSGPTAGEITLVLAAVTLPMTLAYGPARLLNRR